MKKIFLFAGIIIVLTAGGFYFYSGFVSPGPVSNPSDIKNKEEISKEESLKEDKSEPANPENGISDYEGRSSVGKNCDLGAYGLDCAVTRYLEENIAWTVKNGVDFCSYEPMNGLAENTLYLYAACQEFYVSNGKIYEASGTLVPVKLTRKDAGFSHWMPRDGSLNDKDMRENFPAQYLPAERKSDYQKLMVMNRERAQIYFNSDFDYRIEAVLEQACRRDADCETPGKYQLMSTCPFVSKCLNAKCAVICPTFHELTSN